MAVDALGYRIAHVHLLFCSSKMLEINKNFNEHIFQSSSCRGDLRMMQIAGKLDGRHHDQL